jgi:hypothetical protein
VASLHVGGVKNLQQYRSEALKDARVIRLGGNEGFVAKIPGFRGLLAVGGIGKRLGRLDFNKAFQAIVASQTRRAQLLIRSLMCLLAVRLSEKVHLAIRGTELLPNENRVNRLSPVPGQAADRFVQLEHE